MAKKMFSADDWEKIQSKMDLSGELFGLPEKRDDSVVIGSFNIRKLGPIEKRSRQSWVFLKKIVERFDIIAIQEVMDELEGIEELNSMLGEDYGLVVTDVTGTKPGKAGNTERLAFIFNWTRAQRTALASDITHDRSEIASNLYNNRTAFSKAWASHTRKLNKYKKKVKQNKLNDKRAPSKPPVQLPRFVSFIRQPHCVSFRIPGKPKSKPYEFIMINAHLLYGSNEKEREWEFRALIEWLTIRAKYTDKLYHENLLLLGDCNLDFDDDVTVMRTDVDEFLKGLNRKVLKTKKSAICNFPILSPHPKFGVIRTNLREKKTYDQIGFFSNDSRLPGSDSNANAGTVPGEFDYGVFNIGALVSVALHNLFLNEIDENKRNDIYKKTEFDISEHMPVWIRLKKP